MERIVTIPTAGVSNAMAAYTIGFVKLEVHNNVEDAIGAGSGTLVSVGKVHGILTAAHVLDNLPDRGTVGIVEYRGASTTESGRSRWRTPPRLRCEPPTSGPTVRISASCGSPPEPSA